MLATERSHPMRTCAAAPPFSARRLGMSKGRSVQPCCSSPALAAVAFTSKVEPMLGNTERCSHAVGRPLAPRAAFMYMAETVW